MDDFSFTPRGNSEPDNSEQPARQEPPGPRLMFTMTVTQDPVDYLLMRHGLIPSEDLRLTVAQELNRQSTTWVDSVVTNAVARLRSNN